MVMGIWNGQAPADKILSPAMVSVFDRPGPRWSLAPDHKRTFCLRLRITLFPIDDMASATYSALWVCGLPITPSNHQSIPGIGFGAR